MSNSELIQAPENMPIQVSESSMMIQMIQRAAADPAVDVDKMERLMQMHERFVDRSASAAFNAAMVRAQRRIGPVYRSSFNTNPRAGINSSGFKVFTRTPRKGNQRVRQTQVPARRWNF